nr:hypothetical protein Iba_chr09eCG13870 [Ipomoea batatas]
MDQHNTSNFHQPISLSVNSVLAFLSSFPPISSVYRNKKKRIQEQHKRIAARLVGQPLERGTTGTAGRWVPTCSARILVLCENKIAGELPSSNENTLLEFILSRIASKKNNRKSARSSSPEAARNRCSTANTVALSVADCRRSQIPTAGVHFFVAVGSYRRGSAPPVDVSGDKLKFATQP